MAKATTRAILACALGGVLAVVGAAVLADTAGAQQGQPKITLCHQTGSASNPWVEITVAEPAVDLPAHLSHGDFIVVPGRPCPPAGPGPDPDPGPDKVTICHATGSATNPYNTISVSVNGLEGHGDHEDDIIPAPPGGCPGGFTPPPVTLPPVTIPPVTGGVVAPPVRVPSPAPTVVASAAVAPTRVVEIPRTGPSAIAIEAGVAMALLILGGLCLRASARRSANAAAIPGMATAPTAPVEVVPSPPATTCTARTARTRRSRSRPRGSPAWARGPDRHPVGTSWAPRPSGRAEARRRRRCRRSSQPANSGTSSEVPLSRPGQPDRIPDEASYAAAWPTCPTTSSPR